MTFIANRQRVTDLSGVLAFLEITAPSFGATLRIVNDTQDWDSNGHTYIGFPFRIKLPDDTAGQPPRAQLVVDNTGRDLLADLEALQPNEMVTAKIMLADRSNPNAIFQTMHLPLTRASVNAATVSADCSVDYIMRQQAVRIRYNPFTAPGLF
jgi:hypothetical protein